MLLLLMFLVSKFLMREQSYDKILEQKKQELDNAVTEQKPGKQKRRHVYSKHSDKSKSVDDKQKLPDEKQLADDQQKSVDAKEKSPDHKQKLTDDKQKSPDHKQKLQEEKVAQSDVASKAAKPGLFSNLDASYRTTPSASPSKKHVEIESKVETIEPDSDLLSQRSSTPELGLSSHPSRSILMNKDEKSLVIDSESVPETFHPRHAPVDELDKKQQEEGRRLSGTIVIGDVEALREKAEGRSTPSPPAGKSSQKKKKKGKAVEVGSEQDGKAINVNVSHAVEQETLNKTQDVARRDLKDAVSTTVKMLENGDIAEQDCKTLMKALESKGFNVVSSSKKKKDEDFSAETLKKAIKDLETSLQKEKLTAASSEAQVKQLRDQLALEQQKSENLKKSQQSQTTKQLQEISRLEMSFKVHEQERLQLQTRLDTVQSEAVEQSRVVQALMEENAKLKTTAGTSFRNEAKQKLNLLQAPCDDNIDASLESNIKHFEDQFEEMVAKQEMEKMKEDNEVLVHSLRSQIAELNAEALEKDSKIDLLQSHSDSVKSVNEPVVCEKISLTGQQNVSTAPPSWVNAQDGIVANGTEQDSMDDSTAFLDKKVREVEELLQKQRQKNDDLRRRNWKAMEALSEMEKELQKANHAKGKSENAESLVTQLHSVEREKGDLERLRRDQEKLIISLQHQITDLQKQTDHKDPKKITERGLGHGTNPSEHEAQIMKLEDSLNRQIQKNDDLRRRNWKTMEALSEMEKRLQNIDLGSEVNHLRDQLRSLQKDKVDLEILNKGLSSNLATCVQQTEQAEKRSSDALNQLKKVTNEYNALKMAKTSTDGLNDSQLKRNSQLETFISEKNTRIKQLEEELLAAQQRTIANDFSGPVSVASTDSVKQTRADDPSSMTSGSGDRKEVMIMTQIHETSKWDMSQLVLELDTKSAEVEILQSLLDQRENSLHDLQEEKSKTVESVHHMRQALKEKDVAIHSLQAQLKNSAAAEGSVSTTQAEQNSYKEVLLKKDSEIDALKSELLRYQSQIKEFENHDRHLGSPNASEELSDGHKTEVFDSVSDLKASGNEYEKIRAEQKSLEEQVKHYQDVLADTAGMLSKLQLSVEKEESKWLQKVAESEEKAAQAVQEANQLRDELETLRKSS